MWQREAHGNCELLEVRVRDGTWVMCVSTFALGVCTLCIPAHVTPFCVIYALVGFGFSFSYVFNLLFAKRAAAK